MKKTAHYIPLLFFYSTALFALFLYSYTQTDLNLTISRVGFLQHIQKTFQYIGYFQRPLSVSLYVCILISMFTLYAIILRIISTGKLTRKNVWWLVCAGVILLSFSYPAFSYDIFNYMFSAKTVLVYRENPYEVIPRAFASIDPWVAVMRWIHLPSAYAPMWILLTLPFYIFGFGFFLPTLFSFKIIAVISYIVTIWAIGKILDDVDKPHSLLGMAIFAFNPLVIIESLVSAHNDIVMMAVLSVALLLFVRHHKFASIFLISLSAAVKTMTMFIFPIIFLTSYWKTIHWRKWSLVVMLIGFIYVIHQREVLPWYWLWILPFVALLPQITWLTILSFSVSIGLLLRYAPFLYLGHWNDPVPMIKMWVTFVPLSIAIVLLGIATYRKRQTHSL